MELLQLKEMGNSAHPEILRRYQIVFPDAENTSLADMMASLEFFQVISSIKTKELPDFAHGDYVNRVDNYNRPISNSTVELIVDYWQSGNGLTADLIYKTNLKTRSGDRDYKEQLLMGYNVRNVIYPLNNIVNDPINSWGLRSYLELHSMPEIIQDLAENYWSEPDIRVRPRHNESIQGKIHEQGLSQQEITSLWNIYQYIDDMYSVPPLAVPVPTDYRYAVDLWQKMHIVSSGQSDLRLTDTQEGFRYLTRGEMRELIIANIDPADRAFDLDLGDDEDNQDDQEIQGLEQQLNALLRHNEVLGAVRQQAEYQRQLTQIPENLQHDDGRCWHVDEDGNPIDSIFNEPLDLENDIIIRIFDHRSRKGFCFNLSTIMGHWGNMMEDRQHRVVMGDRDGKILAGDTLLTIPDQVFGGKFIHPVNAMKVIQNVTRSGKTNFYLSPTDIIIRQVGVHAMSEFPTYDVRLYELKHKD